MIKLRTKTNLTLKAILFLVIGAMSATAKAQHSLATGLPNRIKPDSLAARITPPLGIFRLPPDIKSLPDNFLDSANLKKILRDISLNLRNPLQLNKASFLFVGTGNNTQLGLPANEAPYYIDSRVFSSWTVADIPVTISAFEQYWSPLSQRAENFSINFDKDAYLSQIQKRLVSKFNPEDLVNMSRKLIDDQVVNARNLLSSELETINQQFNGILNAEISKIKQLADISKLDMIRLRQETLNPEKVKEIQHAESQLAFLQQKRNLGQAVDTGLMATLSDKVKSAKAIQQFLYKVGNHKANWEKSGLLKKIKDFDLLKNAKVKEAIGNPSNIRKLAKRHLSLKGIQRFFLNMNRLDMGQNALSTSPMSFKNFLSNGVIADFDKKGKSLMAIIARQKDMNSVLDYSFTGSLSSAAGMVKAGRMQLAKSALSSTHISISSFDQSLANRIGLGNLEEFRRVLVTTLSNELTLNETNKVSFEISRSATQYQPVGIISDSLLVPKNSLSQLLGSENFGDNMAIAMRYSGDADSGRLSYQFNFSKVSNGYLNPGNSFLTGGSSEWGLSVRRKMFKDKLLVSFRGNEKRYQFNKYLDNIWRNRFFILDARFKMKKGQYLALRYQPVSMQRIENGQRNTVSKIERFSVDANIFKKIKKVTYRTFASLSYQAGENPVDMFSMAKVRSLSLNWTQNIAIGAKLFYITSNISRAKNSSNIFYLNSSFLAEAGYTYILMKRLTLSSGVVYNSIDGWYKQLGLRQTVSGEISKKINANLYVDARKNLKVEQPLWITPFRTDISLQYFFNRK